MGVLAGVYTWQLRWQGTFGPGVGMPSLRARAHSKPVDSPPQARTGPGVRPATGRPTSPAAHNLFDRRRIAEMIPLSSGGGTGLRERPSRLSWAPGLGGRG